VLTIPCAVRVSVMEDFYQSKFGSTALKVPRGYMEFRMVQATPMGLELRLEMIGNWTVRFAGDGGSIKYAFLVDRSAAQLI